MAEESRIILDYREFTVGWDEQIATGTLLETNGANGGRAEHQVIRRREGIKHGFPFLTTRSRRTWQLGQHSHSSSNS